VCVNNNVNVYVFVLRVFVVVHNFFFVVCVLDVRYVVAMYIKYMFALCILYDIIT